MKAALGCPGTAAPRGLASPSPHSHAVSNLADPPALLPLLPGSVYFCSCNNYTGGLWLQDDGFGPGWKCW